MRFTFRGLNTTDFDKWVQQIRSGEGELTRESYTRLAQPSENEPIRRFARVDDTLYHAILNRCVDAGTMCMDHMMVHE